MGTSVRLGLYVELRLDLSEANLCHLLFKFSSTAWLDTKQRLCSELDA